MTQPTINTFIQDFKKTSYYNELYSRPGIIMSYVAGSRLVQADSYLSDFDIVIITDSANPIEDTGIRFRYKDVYTVHFYYHTLDQLLLNTYTMSSRLYAQMQLTYLDRQLLLYENQDYADLITRIFKKKATISKIAMLKYVKNFTHLLPDVAETGLLNAKYHHKYLYHLCYCYYHIAKIKQDTQLLLQAKYSSSGYLTPDGEKKIVEILKKLKPVVDFYTVEDLVAQFSSIKRYILGESLNG